MRFLLLSAAIFLMSVLLVTCIKEYSYEGGPQAEFIIEGSPLTCSPVSIFGSYVTGIILDSSNYAMVIADVTLAGNYNISTNTADGISFSASGTFTDTGRQVVYLKANGRPAADGNFEINVLRDSGCSFNLIVKPKAAASYVLSGSPVDCSNPVIQGNYTQYKQLTNEDTIVLTVNVIAPGGYTINTDTVAGISFSASGYFPQNGNQTVTLVSAGKPNKTGRFYFNVHADSSQCSFSLPITPTFPLAVYVLESGQDTTCYQYSSNGNYISGVPLNNTNTLSFKIYVTDVGNYSIYTKNINGMIFGTSGSFTETGEQTIILSGSGTPSAKGNFLFSPEIIGPSPRGGNLCYLAIQVQ